METVSENASDGIVAPMFYFALGGLPLAMAYKAVNTLDSMVGYKNEKYKNFGRASAKLDDAANYIPARITGFLIIAAAFSISFFRLTVSEFSKWSKKAGNGSKLDITEPLKNIKQNFAKAHFMSGINAFRTMCGDGGKHSSPNSGIPEAAIAGALGVRLGGPSTYGGVFVNKPYIGEEEQGAEEFYLKASEEAVKIIKITSLVSCLSGLRYGVDQNKDRIRK
jgi:adenosylcobinamide-phosphate synthase